MIQRFLYTALKAGLASIQEDLTLLEDIFEIYDLPESEVDAIKTWFQKVPPTVKHQYARTDDTFPLVSIVLAQEGENQTFIGNDAYAFDADDEIDNSIDLYSSIWQHSFDILCYSEHPDGTAYLYEVVKSVFLIADLQQYGLFEFRFSGQDLAPDPRFVPEHLFVRRFSITAQREFQRVDRLSRFQKAFKVAGIHINDYSKKDDGGVKQLTTVSGDGE